MLPPLNTPPDIWLMLEAPTRFVNIGQNLWEATVTHCGMLCTFRAVFDAPFLDGTEWWASTETIDCNAVSATQSGPVTVNGFPGQGTVTITEPA